MRLIYLKHSLIATALIGLIGSCGGCGITRRPMIKVAIGMTVDQLSNGSTYSFSPAAHNLPSNFGNNILPSEGHKLNDWIITQPYDLVYIHNGSRLNVDNLGGPNYLFAIIVGSEKQKIVDHLQITFQNRTLTLDEALSVAERLNLWFSHSGFAVSKLKGRPNIASFSVEQQEASGIKYAEPILSYNLARKAFLDPQAKIINLQMFDLFAEDAEAGLYITNARRQREDISGSSDESNAKHEHEYFVNLAITSHPIDRYWDFKAR